MGKFNKAGFCEDSHESAELVGPPSLVPGAHGSQDRRRPGCAVRAPEKGRALGLGKLPLARAATSQVDVECFPVLKAFPFFLYPQQLLNEENLRKQEESVQKQEAMRQGGFRSARGCLRGCVRGGRAQAGRARRARRASCHGGAQRLQALGSSGGVDAVCFPGPVTGSASSAVSAPPQGCPVGRVPGPHWRGAAACG